MEGDVTPISLQYQSLHWVKKCGKQEVSNLFRDSFYDVTNETFDKLLE